MGKEEYIEFIDTYFQTQVVEEDDGNIFIKFIPKNGAVGRGEILFEKAKTGWFSKPIITNNYLIVDAYLNEIIDFLSKYYNLTDNNYNDVRRGFIDKSLMVIEEHFNKT